MKLLYCKVCGDIVRLYMTKRYCLCGGSYGYYTSEINARYGGEAIPIGIHNQSFADALRQENYRSTWGITFKAFIIPENSDHIESD